MRAARQRGADVDVGAALVAQHRQRPVRQGEVGVERDRLGERLDRTGLHPHDRVQAPVVRRRGRRRRAQRQAHQVAGQVPDRPRRAQLLGDGCGDARRPGCGSRGRRCSPTARRAASRRGSRSRHRPTRSSRPAGRRRCAARGPSSRPSRCPAASRSSSSGSATRRTSPCGPVQLTTAATSTRRPDASHTARPSDVSSTSSISSELTCSAPAARSRAIAAAEVGRHPVSVQVPPGCVAGEEVGALVGAEPGPEVGRQRPEGVEGRPPVAGLAHRGGDALPHQPAHRREVGRRETGRLLGELGARRRRGRLRPGRVRGGHPAAAGDGVQGAARAGRGSGRGRPW